MPTRGIRRRAALLVAAVAAAGALAGCDGYGPSHASGATGYGRSAYAATSHPTPAEQAATIVATRAFRRYVTERAEQLTAALRAITADARAGDLAAARDDELVAQGDFDAVRASVAAGSATQLALDGAPGDATARDSGLLLVSRDLWSSPARLADAARQAARLGPLALEVAFVLSRDVLTPAQMLAQAQLQLAWVAAAPLEGTEEPYSHRDLVDVAAAVGSAAEAVAVSVPLGRLVAPSVAAACVARLAALQSAVEVLGPPAARADATVGLAAWRTIAEQLQSADGVVGELAGAVYGFGTGRTYA